MEPNSQNNTNANDINAIEGQIRECYGRVVYSHKTHEKCADILLDRYAKIKLWQIILSAVTSAGFIAITIQNSKLAAILGVLVSITLLVLNTYTKDYDLGEIAQKHKNAASKLWLIRERYLSLLTDIKLNIRVINEVADERDALMKELHSIYIGAESTTHSAYQEAKKALKEYEEMTFAEEEIDAFLPKELRRTEQ